MLGSVSHQRSWDNMPFEKRCVETPPTVRITTSKTEISILKNYLDSLEISYLPGILGDINRHFGPFNL